MVNKLLKQKLSLLPKGKRHKTIDVYAGGTIVLYSGKPLPKYNFKPIGSQGGGFQSAGRGVIRRDLGNGLQERIDYSGHNGAQPHINYDLLGATKKFSKDALGDAHYVNLV